MTQYALPMRRTHATVVRSAVVACGRAAGEGAR